MPRFSDELMQVLGAAREEACRLGKTSIGIDHLLLAILQLGESKGAILLQSVGMDLFELINQLETGHSLSNRIPPPVIEVVLSSGAQRIVTSAEREAQALGSAEVNSAHVVLSISRDADQSVAGVLVRGGASYRKLRARVARRPR